MCPSDEILEQPASVMLVPNILDTLSQAHPPRHLPTFRFRDTLLLVNFPSQL